MTFNFIVAQTFGVVALFVVICSFQQNDRKTLLKYQVISSLLYGIQYIFLNAYTGAFMHLIAMTRNFIFSKYENKKVPLLWLMIILELMIGLGALSYNEPISLLPTVAAIQYSISVWIGNLRLIRFSGAITSVCFIIYNIKVFAITGLIATIIELVATLAGIYKFDVRNRQNLT